MRLAPMNILLCLWCRQDRAVRTDVYTVMHGLAKSLPMYVWLVALSQLTSRICHPHDETKLLTQHILTRVIAAFPHQVVLRHISTSIC